MVPLAMMLLETVTVNPTLTETDVVNVHLDAGNIYLASGSAGLGSRWKGKMSVSDGENVYLWTFMDWKYLW